MKISDYSIVSSGNYMDASVQVSALIEQGYQPFGPVVVVATVSGSLHPFRYTQTMVKYEKESLAKE